MKVIIAGSRSFVWNADRYVAQAIGQSGFMLDIETVIHGGAYGIDQAAGRVCAGIWPVVVVPADWNTHGRSAGPIRNRQMADMADALIAVWDGKSRGTANMIKVAREKGLKVFVYEVE